MAPQSPGGSADDAPPPPDPWRGYRPLSRAALPLEVEAFQLQKLADAHALLDELSSRDGSGWRAAAASKNSSTFAISLSTMGKGWAVPCTADAEVVFYDTWYVVIKMRIRALPAGLLTAIALLHDADLISLPRWPGLPVIEGVEVPHRFAANDLIVRPLVQPWGPFPGADSIHNALIFATARKDSSEHEPGSPQREADVSERSSGARYDSLLVYLQSPPEGSTEHRGWKLPPVGRRRKRNVLLGMAQRIRPAYVLSAAG